LRAVIKDFIAELDAHDRISVCGPAAACIRQELVRA